MRLNVATNGRVTPYDQLRRRRGSRLPASPVCRSDWPTRNLMGGLLGLAGYLQQNAREAARHLVHQAYERQELSCFASSSAMNSVQRSWASARASLTVRSSVRTACHIAFRIGLTASK